MARYIIEDTTLIALADKARALAGTTEGMTTSEMTEFLEETIHKIEDQRALVNQLLGSVECDPSEPAECLLDSNNNDLLEILNAIENLPSGTPGAGEVVDESELILQSEIMDEILAVLAAKNPKLYPEGAFRLVSQLSANKSYVLAFSYEGALYYLTDTAFNDWTVQAATLSMQDQGSHVTFTGSPTRFTTAASGSGFTFTTTAGSLTGNASSGGTDLKVDSNAGTVFTVDTSENGGFDSGVYVPKSNANAVWLRAALNSQNCCLKYESANVSVGIDYAGRDATYSTGFLPFLLYELCEGEAMA